MRLRIIAAVTTLMTGVLATATMLGAAPAGAQEAPPPDDGTVPVDPPADPPLADVSEVPPGAAVAETLGGSDEVPRSLSPEVDISERARPFRPPVDVQFPFVFNSPTARLLPGAVIYTSSGIDTGRGLSSQLEVGLGDVAEFGVTVSDLIRGQDGDNPNSEPDGLFPYVLAHFKMGVGEGKMTRHMPAFAMGFRKSFERNVDDHTSQVAELYFVASKNFGSKLTLHAGGSFWDASLSNGVDAVSLHGSGGAIDQLRGFGGIELRPLPDAQIMLEVFYVPQFVYHEQMPEAIELHPQLAWGVRYELLSWAVIEAGVRIPEIDDVKLMDAQIFGQFKIVTRKLREALRIE
jgi:hypothetical protein